MRKVLLGLAVAVLLVLAFSYFGTSEPNPNATPCEKDCINDSGGKAWCADYCKKHGTYGPATK